MCGIAGVVGDVSPTLIKAMTGALGHRGPDSEGYAGNGRIRLGVRRLRIIDLLTGDQPIHNEQGDMCLIANCEVYNFRELRDELVARGHRFRTEADSETILHAFEEFGREGLARIRGMFAFAILDGNHLFLARDRMGIKPLYYVHLREKNVFLFASEIKALLRCDFVPSTLNLKSFANRLVIGYPFGDETVFQEVKTLRPGHWLRVDDTDGGIRIEEGEYFRLSVNPDDLISYPDAERELFSVIGDALEQHMVSDVPVCLTLSGGLDSSILAFNMRALRSGPISTFTVGDPGTGGDLLLSREIATAIGACHRESVLDFETYLQYIAPCTLAEEQPSSLFGLPLLLLCHQMRESATVCLNGEGADELWGGYEEYRVRYRKLNMMRQGLTTARRIGIEPADEVLHWTETLQSAISWDDYLQKIFLLNLQDQLVRRHLEILDHYSMAASLELRVPFLDDHLVAISNRLPLSFKVRRELGIGKYIVKRLALHFWGDCMVNSVLREKAGFPASGLYLCNQFTEMCSDSVSDSYAQTHPMREFFMFEDHSGRHISKKDIVLFELFKYIFADHRGRLPSHFEILEFIRQYSDQSVRIPKHGASTYSAPHQICQAQGLP